jgi:hypothetical protein
MSPSGSEVINVCNSAQNLAICRLLNNQAESRVVAWKGPVPKLKQWYQEGVDVHAYVCRLIAKVVQESNIQTPLNIATGKQLFKNKNWDRYSKGDEEREISKRTVHAYNYGMGVAKFALITGLSEQFATILLKIYSTLFPEIKTNYHAWVEGCIRKNRTIWMPEPVKFRKIFYDIVDDELMRSAYSCYPQCTVGAMLSRTIAHCCRIFKEDKDDKLREQWCAWYGGENWERWLRLRNKDVKTPEAILWSGMDVRLNIHDAGGISIPDDPALISWAVTTWKSIAETPIKISDKEELIIPVDFKIGATWGSNDLKDYKID